MNTNFIARRGAYRLAIVASLVASSLPLPVWALGSTPVTVVNPSASPVPTKDVDNPARHPFVAQCDINVMASSVPQFCDLGTVPAGSVLVVETVLGSIGTTVVTDPNLSAFGVLERIELLATDTLNVFVVYPLAATVLPTSTLGTQTVTETLSINQPMRTYIDEGLDLRIQLFSKTAITATTHFLVSGYLVSKS
jgi:hypothetical protein